MAMIVTGRRAALTGALLASAPLVLPLGSRAAASAPPPKPPSVYTGAFAVVSTFSVTLKGSVNPRGIATVYAFQFGTTTGYGAQTAPVSVGSGTAEVKVSQTIAGLQPYTTYHYRLIATNTAGTTNGHDVVFTTKKIPLTIKLAAAPEPDVFGNPFTVSGRLSGTDAANHALALQANPFPYLGGFKNTSSTTVTHADGSFSFHVPAPLLNTQFRVATIGAPTVNSGAVIERVAVRVSLHLRSTRHPGFVRLHGFVEPAAVGEPVSFQLMRPGHPPLRVAGTKTRRASAGASRFSRVLRIRRGGLYRAFVLVNNGKQVSGHSRSLLIR